ncbi:Cof-type HAD-IIB family hydrolase [uncultured Bifidobacterium sp.]|uniref:Cof-type HAD-IIB family hydrolase n=1 Tax=uncultured Bifidobacterium sp. TaxID=165187 RepID=UPI00260FEAE1|nr:Cof-type HAD-IIB family hydrolase [uncultured Bifidobacterium sp.]
MARDWTSIPWGGADLKLVVADMDGTLLDVDGRVPESFWSVLDLMRRRGVCFVPASGRQYATLRAMFGAHNPGGSYIAENGNLVVADGSVVSVTGMDREDVRHMVDAGEEACRSGRRDIAVVLCCPDCAYVSRDDPKVIEEASKYYANLRVVRDLASVRETVIKVAVVDFANAQDTADQVFAGFRGSHQVVVSGLHWVDIMDHETDKRRGVLALRQALGVAASQTAVFGDYLNDLEMLSAGEWSFAMANAHRDLLIKARFVAPSNADNGVVRVLRRLLGISSEGAGAPVDPEREAGE